MQFLTLFLGAAITALSVENVIFARALGINRSLLFLKSPKMAILYGVALTWIATVSSLLVSLVNYLLPPGPHVQFVRAPLFFLCAAIAFTGTYWLIRKKAPKLHRTAAKILPISTFNSAMFGIFYVSVGMQFEFAQTVGYALGAGIGYTLGLLVIYYSRKRLAICPVPRTFRGLPILLVYIGLVSLAIFGLIGHILPI